ncbi:glycosyltransferase family 4 protein [Alteromonas sp. Cnat3-28]|uniref:glycosyltransferase family 4 protein n=1 Tax=Alteromonas sp. Cnat3-28 TaxID=2917729 RepID=UPI001EF4BFC6|nr:glycosyltransferase family 4 protein [Alteromonas sp. Cnat3-28]MCG7644897.1 glycosyltransferase family 4 protein [Alteromonas sp. Cnat3-28]
MKFWLPHTIGNSGSDVSIHQLADCLKRLGHEAEVTSYPYFYQYCPHLLKGKAAPANTDCVIGNSWNAFAFKRAGIPLLTVERLFVLDPEYSKYKSHAQKIFHNTLLKRWLYKSYTESDVNIALSQNSADALTSYFPDIKPNVILNAVNTQFFAPAAKETKNATEFRLLYVGNISKRKGCDMLPAILDGTSENVHLYYTADRDPSKTISHSRAHCLGRLTLDQVKREYQKADATILPSRLEGLPRAVMESISCGTPVISSSASSLPEIVKENVSGIPCETDNPLSYATAINKLANDASFTNMLEQNCRAFALEYLDLDKMVQQYVNLVSS